MALSLMAAQCSMQMAGSALLNIMFLMLWVDPAQAPNALLPCSDSLPPCIEQPVSQNMCLNKNVSISTAFLLTNDIIPLIRTPDIRIYGNAQEIIVGLSVNPQFQGKGRWKASQILREKTDKTGILTVLIDISDVQPADELQIHIEIHTNGQTWSTPAENWFVVDNCTLTNIFEPGETRSEIFNKLHASILHLETTRQDIELKFKEFIAEMRSIVLISNETYSLADVAALISNETYSLADVAASCLAFFSVVCVLSIMYWVRKHITSKLKNTLESRTLIQGNEELDIKKLMEILQKVNERMDKMNVNETSLIPGHIAQQNMNTSEVERLAEREQKWGSRGIHEHDEIVMNEQKLEYDTENEDMNEINAKQTMMIEW